MSELRELYHSVILDHNKQPRNFRQPEGANRSAEGYNPFCGDKLTVFVKLVDGVLADIGFEGSGCAISKASASLMTKSVMGKSADEVNALFEGFHQLVTDSPTGEIDASRLGKLAVFGGVREFPVRVKCATLAWHTLRSALDGSGEVAKTE